MTVPVPFALLVTSTYGVPVEPEVLTAGRLRVRSNWYVPVAEWKRKPLPPTVAAPSVRE